MADARARVLSGRGQGEDEPAALLFNGYALGAFDALEGVHQICPPQGVRVEQVMDAVSNHVRRLPQNRLVGPADVIVAAALKAAYPCVLNFLNP